MAKVNVDFINPFLEATLEVLETMAFIKAKNGNPYAVNSLRSTSGVVTGIIGMVGAQIHGALAVSFSKGCILRIVSNMLGEEFTEIDDIVIDAVGELTNMISGGTKKRLSDKGFSFNMAIPSMIRGKGIKIYHQSESKSAIVIPFSIPEGEFWVEACLKVKN